MRYSWFLPKTVFDVTATFVFESCDEKKQLVTARAAATLATRGVPDANVGPIKITPEDLKSFWQDRGIHIKTFPATNILQTISSDPESQVGTIVNNVLQGVVKLSAAVLGVAPGAGFVADPPIYKGKFCGQGAEILTQIAALREKLLDPKTPDAELKRLPAQIEAKESSITVKIETMIDPGWRAANKGHPCGSKLPPEFKNPPLITEATGIQHLCHSFPIPPTGVLARIRPTIEGMQEANWLHADYLPWVASKDKKVMQEIAMRFDPLVLDVALDLSRRACKSCVRIKGVPPGTLFREVVHLPVFIKRGDALVTAPKLVAFGQFGVPKSLPLSAGLFEKLGWNVTFTDTGEMAEAKFTSKATGIGFSTLFGQAASTVNTIVTQTRAADVADPDTARLEAENKAVQARIQSLELNKKLQDLLKQRTN